MIAESSKWVALCIAAALMALVGPAAAAEVMAVGGSKLQFSAPDGWKSTVDPSGHILLQHGASPATLLLVPVPVAELDATLKRLDKALHAQFEGLELSPPERGQFGDIPVMVSEGKARTDGLQVEIGLLVLWPSEGWAVIVQGLVDPAQSEKARPGAAALFGSFRRAPGAKPAPTPWADEAGVKNAPAVPKPAAKP